MAGQAQAQATLLGNDTEHERFEEDVGKSLFPHFNHTFFIKKKSRHLHRTKNNSLIFL